MKESSENSTATPKLWIAIGIVAVMGAVVAVIVAVNRPKHDSKAEPVTTEAMPEFAFRTENVEGLEAFTPLPLTYAEHLRQFDPTAISEIRVYSIEDLSTLGVLVVVYDIAKDIEDVNLRNLHLRLFKTYLLGMGATWIGEIADQPYDSPPVTLENEISRDGKVAFGKLSMTLFYDNEHVWIGVKCIDYGQGLESTYDQITFSR